MKGFSVRNLKYMRAFALAYPDEAIVQQSAAQLPWFHLCVLLDKVKRVR
jgi:predicted nuclease of restriction endonuclease-like (RecB) superfamily